MFGKVVGVTQIRNEWPLAALSITHALLIHVHEVYVIDHASTDGTASGLERLKTMWPGRIHVIRCNMDTYWQEAAINAVIALIQALEQDWIYVFDADEFLLLTAPLQELLSGVASRYSAVRYSVQNWISVSQFNDETLDDYRLLRYRSFDNLLLTDSRMCSDEILNGIVNFFDVPFPPKLIIRGRQNLWLGAGAHGLKGVTNSEILDMRGLATIRCAHFPILSRRRLVCRAEHGRHLIDAGFGPNHGWQNQLVARIQREGNLDPFWSAHSVSSESGSENATRPTYTIDDGFLESVGPAIDKLETTWATLERHGDSTTRLPTEDSVSFSDLLRTARRFQSVVDAMSEAIVRLSKRS